jgi:hypothetical protein
MYTNDPRQQSPSASVCKTERLVLTKLWAAYGDDGTDYRCPSGPPGTDSARARLGTARTGSCLARHAFDSGRAGSGHVPGYVSKHGPERPKTCQTGPKASEPVQVVPSTGPKITELQKNLKY